MVKGIKISARGDSIDAGIARYQMKGKIILKQPGPISVFGKAFPLIISLEPSGREDFTAGVRRRITMEILTYIFSALVGSALLFMLATVVFQDQVSRGTEAVLDSIEYALASRKQRYATSRRTLTGVPQTSVSTPSATIWA